MPKFTPFSSIQFAKQAERGLLYRLGSHHRPQHTVLRGQLGSIKAAWIAPRKSVRKCHREDRSSVHPSYETGSGRPLWLPDQKGPRGPCGGQNTGAATLGWGLGPRITSSPALPLQAGATSMTEPQNPPCSGHGIQ